MKTEAEIRSHIATLERLLATPCDCAAGDHAMECRVGGIMMQSVIRHLRWVLGEQPDVDGLLRELRKRQADPRRN